MRRQRQVENSNYIVRSRGRDMGNPWYNAPQYRAQAEDGNYYYPTWAADFANRAYAKSAVGNALAPASLSDMLTTTRASTGTYFDATGTLRIAAINEPRFTHEYVDGQWVKRGLLIEGQKTNIQPGSNNMSGTAFSNAGAGTGTATQTGAICPDGTISTRQTNSGTSNYARQGLLYQIGTVADGSTWTASVYIKRAVGNPQVRLALQEAAGDFTTYGAQNFNVTDEWRRVALTATKAADGNPTRVIMGVLNGVAGDAVDVCFFQMEEGTYPTSYIPTDAAAVTRASDNVSTLNVEWLDASKGTFIAQYNAKGIYNNATPFAASADSGLTNAVFVISEGTSGGLSGFVTTTSGTGGRIVGAASGFPSFSKVGISYPLANTRMAIDGTLYAGTSHSPPVALNRLTLGNGTTSLSRFLNGTLAFVAYYPQPLTASELQRLTT